MSEICLLSFSQENLQYNFMYMNDCPTPFQVFKEQITFLCLQNYLVTIPEHPTPRYILKIFESIRNNVLK